MYRIDNRGNIRLPWGDTLLACIPLCAEIPEGTEAVLSDFAEPAVGWWARNGGIT